MTSLRVPLMVRSGPLWTCLQMVVLLLGVLPDGEARGCPYTIRDVGYSSWNRGRYLLYFFPKDDTPESRRAAEWFRKTAAEALADANVEAEVVASEKRDAHDAAIHLDTLGVKEFPAAILVSPDDRAIARSGIGPGAASEDAMRAALERVVSSPAMADLTAHCITNWCIVLFVPGTDEEKSARARSDIEAASEEIVGTVTDMGRTVESGPHLIVASAKDPAERVLLWSFQLDGEAKEPRAAILYGRGVQFGPTLQGDGISKETLLMVFRGLGRNCSCTIDPAVWAGPSLLMRWGEGLRMEVQNTFGFDPDSPRFRSSVADYVPGARPGSFMQGVIGYTEDYVEYVDKSPTAPTVAMPIAAADEPPPLKTTSTMEERTGHTMVFVLVGMALGVVVASVAVVLWRVRGS